MRICFIGQAPSRETDGKPPFTGKCGKFLAELLGTTQEQMLVDHDFVNVIDYWPGKGPNGDKFPMTEAKIRARAMLKTLSDRTVVLLGANVARAFGASKFEYFSRYQILDPETKKVVVSQMTVIPHPSGINRKWNDPEIRIYAYKFLTHLAAK